MEQRSDPEWTDADLALLQSLDAAGNPVELIARRLGRTEQAIEDHLSIARAREGTLPVPDGQPGRDGDWHGPDEEGDVTPPQGWRDDDKAAWVHRSPE
ncbi:MAG: hypothetical protein JWR77_2127 [Rhizorhabdus sp.]|nr:hypothetical protein [Rhizorhabdus sp.]